VIDKGIDTGESVFLQSRGNLYRYRIDTPNRDFLISKIVGTSEKVLVTAWFSKFDE
jgi:hypothetical protein